jgi:hypothetical protein
MTCQEMVLDHRDGHAPFLCGVRADIHAEIRAGRRHRDDVRIAAAGVLRQGPALTRFLAQIQRTVDAGYRWDPWPHHRKFPRLRRTA